MTCSFHLGLKYGQGKIGDDFCGYSWGRRNWSWHIVALGFYINWLEIIHVFTVRYCLKKVQIDMVLRKEAVILK